MKLSNDAWHVRWFNFVQSQIGDFSYSSGTNLCHYMRVTMLWGPLLILLAAGAVGSILWVLVGLPILIFGMWGLPLVWAIIGAFATAVYGIVYLIGKYAAAPVGSAAYCVYQHARAVKGRFCPLVSFDAKGPQYGI